MTEAKKLSIYSNKSEIDQLKKEVDLLKQIIIKKEHPDMLIDQIKDYNKVKSLFFEEFRNELSNYIEINEENIIIGTIKNNIIKVTLHVYKLITEEQYLELYDLIKIIREQMVDIFIHVNIV